MSAIDSFSYLAIFVHLIVGELDLLEGDDLLPELIPGVGSVGVDVEAVGWGRICLPSYQP